jgi:hypothetical protein
LSPGYTTHPTRSHWLDLFEAEAIVVAVVGVPPFSTIDGKANAEQQFLILDGSLDIIELDVEAEPIPAVGVASSLG